MNQHRVLLRPEAERQRELAKLAERLDLERALTAREPHRWHEDHAGAPTLQLEDVSAIPFLDDISGVELYQHRARVRAGDGDLFCAVTPVPEGYEAYCQEQLSLGAPECLVADPVGSPLAVARAAASGRTYARLTEIAKSHGNLAIHPYMSIEPVWELAARLAVDTGAAVRVLGSPPEVTWIANDKALFADAVIATLGSDWLVETYTETAVEALARRLRELASRHRSVAIKRLRCASAMGNSVWPRREIRDLDNARVERLVTEFLERTQWPNGEPVQAVAWMETDHSPSTQLWIPQAGCGAPRLDGVYDQILIGEEKMFLGSRPSQLPAPVVKTLGEAALAVAGSLQELGYIGRCSFDHLVTGDVDDEFRVLFVECNGRWGGTSTPMSLVDRLIGGPRPPYRAQDYVDEHLIGVPFSEIRARLASDLFDPHTGQGRFILYNVGPLEPAGKFDVISLGGTQNEAEEGVLERLPDLLARG